MSKGQETILDVLASFHSVASVANFHHELFIRCRLADGMPYDLVPSEHVDRDVQELVTSGRVEYVDGGLKIFRD